jgi:hypothetical protein
MHLTKKDQKKSLKKRIHKKGDNGEKKREWTLLVEALQQKHDRQSP